MFKATSWAGQCYARSVRLSVLVSNHKSVDGFSDADDGIRQLIEHYSTDHHLQQTPTDIKRSGATT